MYAAVTDSLCFIHWSTRCKAGQLYSKFYDIPQCNNWIEDEIQSLQHSSDSKANSYLNRAHALKNSCIRNVVDVATEAGGFETLLRLVEQEGLTDRLKDDECKTVLAPTNEVFDQLPPGALDNLVETNTVVDVLVKHVIPQCLTSDQIESGFVKTAGGVEIELIKNPDGSVEIKSGTGLYKIVQSDISASNGLIHVVDGVFV
jgi:uncharacterized surface protein with fasciclin (FAS1) repeats